ncbi:MAG: ABC transporter permease, partial [Gammaproteobacteria bacterium]
GKICGYLLLAVVIAGIAGMPLLLYAHAGQVLLWSISLFCELSIVIALCLFFLFTLGQVIAALSAVAAFYLLARSMGSMQLLSHSPIMDTGAWSHEIIRTLLDVIASLLPDLDAYTQTAWLIYGSGGARDLAHIAVQTLIYVGLLSAAALFDLYRRNF